MSTKMLYPLLALVNSIFMVAQFVINGLSANGPDGTVFLNKTSILSDKYSTDVTPAGWTFSIWGFIYCWQTLWVMYSLINICRKGPHGPAYQDPMFLPMSLFLICIIICALNITWLITFDREKIEVSCAALIAYSFLMYAALVVSYRSLDKASPKLAEQRRTVDIWLTRGLVHNGLGIQATWITIATLLNVAMVMTYSGEKTVGIETAGTVVLSILSAEISIFAVTDLFFLDRYSRYTITPYIVVVVALIGSITKNYKEGATNSIFTVVLLAVAGFLLLVKLIVTVYRHFTKQHYRSHYESTIEDIKATGVLA